MTSADPPARPKRLDNADLEAYYRGTMAEKVADLREALATYASNPGEGSIAIRSFAHKVHGSAASFGFAELGQLAKTVEAASDASLESEARRLLKALQEVRATSS